MIVHCANCEREGRPAFMREKAPFDNRSISHGICDEHKQAFLAEAARLIERMRDGEATAAV